LVHRGCAGKAAWNVPKEFVSEEEISHIVDTAKGIVLLSLTFHGEDDSLVGGLFRIEAKYKSPKPWRS